MDWKRALLAAAAVAVFAPALWSPFHLDDYSIFSDPALTSPSGWREVWALERTRPLTYLTFWANHAAGGRNPAGYHAVNLALHAAAVWLALGVLCRLLPTAAALCAAALFALHPIQTEPVVYVFARGTLLMTALALASLGEWLRGRHWRAVAWFAAALAAKEECAALPLALLLRRIAVSRDRREWKPLAAMLLLALAAGLRVIWATTRVAGAGSGFGVDVTPLEYAAVQGAAILRYLRLLILPWGFSIEAPALEGGWLAWAALAALATAVWRLGGARAGLWFLAGLVLLLPSSSIFPAADAAADRRMYLPMLAFGSCLALALERLPRRSAVAACLLCAALSLAQSLTWTSERALWEQALRAAPDKVRPRVQLARQADAAGALRLLEEARSIAPGDPLVASEMGRAYMAGGDYARALAEFGRALGLAPGDARAVNNRGAALLALGQREAARQDFERALRMQPCLFDARLNLLRLGIRSGPAGGCRYTPDQEKALEGEP